jgi:hypothetical protein
MDRRATWYRAVGALSLAALAALAACGGGSSSGGATETPRDVALAVSRPGDLLAYVKVKLAQRAKLRGEGHAVDGTGLPPPVAMPGSDGGAPVLRSSTTVQEAGVDEPDLMKTDGRAMYTLRRVDALLATVSAHALRADGTLDAPAMLPLPLETERWPVLHGMLLDAAERRIAVLGESVGFAAGGPCGGGFCSGVPAIAPQASDVEVHVVDVTADAGLAARARYRVSGRLVGARLIGSALFVVSTHAPTLAVDALPSGTSDAERDAALAALQAQDVLPTLRIGDAAPQPLLAETDCYVQAGNASPALEITSISVFDLRAPDTPPASRCIVGGHEALYMSASSLVLATTRYDYAGGALGDVALVYPAEIRTDLHAFALGDGVPAYRGSGSVAGHLGWDPARKPYRLGEHAGDLRVLTFTGETGWASAADASALPASPATLTVLRERAGVLEAVAQLPNERRPEAIGKPGEQVYGVRFVGTRGYVVTFRQIDPLYVLDLSDPADPRVAGALEVPGFSDHLFELADGVLLGVGRAVDADGALGGVKVALFDVRDAARPALRDERVFGGAGSVSALESGAHGLNWLRVGAMARVALPMLVWQDTSGAQGLQRFEVDTAAFSLTTKPMLGVTAAPADGPWAERSLQVGDRVYYLSGDGALGSLPW